MQYVTPKTLNDALEALGTGDISVVAGGTDWFPLLGDKPVKGSLLDVTGIAGFRGIEKGDQGWRIGAATTWADISAAELPACFDGLRAAAREIGSVQIQNAGTVAGNICNASPAADGVVPLLTLGASVELVSKAGVRVVALSDFITGVRQTVLQPGELVSAILIPDMASETCSSFIKVGSRRYLVISIAMVAVALTLNKGRIVDARVAVGACSPVARRLGELEKTLLGRNLADYSAVVKVGHLAPLSPVSDLRGSAEFRGELVLELCNRAIGMAFSSGGQDNG